MEKIELNEENFLMYAIKHYDNPECTGMKEFEEDLGRSVYIKRLFRRYHKKKELKERLILGHMITFYNVFGIDAATKMLLYKLEPELYYILKTFMVFLSYFPKGDLMIEDMLLRIDMDENIIKVLREI
jgi:hypothetical protein